MEKTYKKTITGYLTITIPISVEVEAKPVEYEYVVDENTMEIVKHQPHFEEEYEIGIDDILDQHKDIREFINTHKFEEIKFDEQ